MIKKLDQRESLTANEIYNILQAPYTVEANLIGVKNFPPLRRSASHIRDSKTEFFGFWKYSSLSGLVEIEQKESFTDL